MYQRLRSEVEENSGGVIRLTQDLIRIPTPHLHRKELARSVARIRPFIVAEGWSA